VRRRQVALVFGGDLVGQMDAINHVRKVKRTKLQPLKSGKILSQLKELLWCKTLDLTRYPSKRALMANKFALFGCHERRQAMRR